ncbi:hypothetical protein [Chloroflexus aurantiacus]|nr:hypothetical protein [Chloroflexus aurantiacus]
MAAALQTPRYAHDEWARPSIRVMALEMVADAARFYTGNPGAE